MDDSKYVDRKSAHDRIEIAHKRDHSQINFV